MKKLILAIVTVLSLQLHAADVVVVVSATEVIVNGVLAGKPADTIRNRPELASAIQLALEQREAILLAQITSATNARVVVVNSLRAAGTDVAKLVAARTEALKPDVDRQKAVLAAEILAKQRELESLK